MARRNANGEGSIYKRKDGRWEGAVSLITMSGRSKRLRVYGKTRKEVNEKLSAAKLQAHQGMLLPDKTWQLGDYLDHWLESIVRVNRRRATYVQCERVVRLYLQPALGKFDLKQLSVPTVQGFLNESLNAGTPIPTIQVIRKVLSSALTSAQREELVARNVARLVVVPTSSYEPKKIDPWTLDETRLFLGAAKSDRLYAAFALLAAYGLRRGEVLGLRWRDIDFSEDVVYVRYQLQRAEHGLELAPLKTRASRRSLPLIDPVRAALLFHRSRVVSPSPDALVFSGIDGGPLEASVLLRTFKRICLGNGIRPIRIHDLRHGAATLLKSLGVPVREAQLLLGHARVTTTQEIYQHDDMHQRRSSLELVAKALGDLQAKDDTLRYRLVRGRSRQNCRQIANFVDPATPIISGAGWGTLTPGLVLGKSIEATLNGRLASVEVVSRRHTRAWKLGCVAVSIAVKSSGPELAG